MRFKVCLVCKALIWREFSLCEHCLGALTQLRAPRTRDEGRLRIHSLFGWSRSSPRAFFWLVQSLKRKEQVWPWSEISTWLLTAFGPLDGAVLVPIPSSQKRNHACGLARALAESTGFAMIEALSTNSERSQKTLSRGDRHDIGFEREIWDFNPKSLRVIVVDDVVTTGATARAAYHALGRPSNCEVWCVLDRRPYGQS